MTSSLVPRAARLVATTPLTATERHLRLALDAPLNHQPGQFLMISVLGVGEAPISISCPPDPDRSEVELVIRRVGRLTRVLHRLEVGAQVHLRGPFGSGFPLDELAGRDLLFVAGGLGLAPLRSLIDAVLDARARYGTISVVSGCRDPSAEIYRDHLARWAALPDVHVHRLVDRTAHMPWDGEVGLVTAPLRTLPLDPAQTTVAMCGPPVMYKFALLELVARGLGAAQIFVDLERRMRCGVGQCGHCQINHAYCCQEGPVFRLSDLQALPEALL